MSRLIIIIIRKHKFRQGEREVFSLSYRDDIVRNVSVVVPKLKVTNFKGGKSSFKLFVRVGTFMKYFQATIPPVCIRVLYFCNKATRGKI